jgi:hypothetical protein
VGGDRLYAEGSTGGLSRRMCQVQRGSGQRKLRGYFPEPAHPEPPGSRHVAANAMMQRMVDGIRIVLDVFGRDSKV